MTDTLLLRLAAPLQSWGSRSDWGFRDTAHMPTKSGVIGLVASALGRPRDADIADLTNLRMGVRADSPGEIAKDFQTVQGVPNSEGKHPSTVISDRYYIQDAVFLVGLEGDRETLQSIDAACESPMWFLALGRKAFVPTPPVTLGLQNGGLEAALRSHPWLLDEATSGYQNSPLVRRLRRSGSQLRLACTIDSDREVAHEQVRDVPLSFASRRFGSRFVRFETIEVEIEEVSA